MASSDADDLAKKIQRAVNLAETNPEEALRLCNEVLNVDRNHQQALFSAGYIMLKADRQGLAWNLLNRCDQLNPNKAEIHNNLGMTLEFQDPDRALEHFNRALELNPRNHNAMINKGLSLLRMADPKGCVDWCTKALETEPNATGAYENRAQGHLMLGNWAQGWDDYQYSLGLSREMRDYGLPEWNGEPGTVLVYGEQGLGDEILFASCIPDLMETNHVIIDCDSRLEGVFRRSFGVPVYGTRFQDHTPILDEHHCDYQIAIGELPRFLRRSDESFTGESFLKADPERCLQWRALLDTLPGLKIGIAWTGGNPNTLKDQRSFDLATFACLFDLPHTFISLEYEEPDLAGYPVKHWGRAVNKGVDYDETLALISELDLVICVTTTAVHAAGALGVPCWCLVPKYPSSRFLLDGYDIPWHGSVVLRRQETTWSDLVFHVKQDLIQLASEAA